jgi:hypothetical protein
MGLASFGVLWLLLRRRRSDGHSSHIAEASIRRRG